MCVNHVKVKITSISTPYLLCVTGNNAVAGEVSWGRRQQALDCLTLCQCLCLKVWKGLPCLKSRVSTGLLNSSMYSKTQTHKPKCHRMLHILRKNNSNLDAKQCHSFIWVEYLVKLIRAKQNRERLPSTPSARSSSPLAFLLIAFTKSKAMRAPDQSHGYPLPLCQTVFLTDVISGWLVNILLSVMMTLNLFWLPWLRGDTPETGLCKPADKRVWNCVSLHQ